MKAASGRATTSSRARSACVCATRPIAKACARCTTRAIISLIFPSLGPHPEEPERSEGVSKDGRESEPAAMVRDGAHRSQVYAGCACNGAPPHHEAERVERDTHPEGAQLLRADAGQLNHAGPGIDRGLEE